MKFRLSLLCLVTTLALFASSVLEAYAASSSSILVSIIPPSPAPYENTTVNLNSYANNLDTALISWSVNGKNITSGTGKKTFSLTAPAAGGEANITATITLPDGTISTNIKIKPSVMVLLWQAEDSYVPPFYKGKALPAPDSEIRVVAMPEIRNASGNVSAGNMAYSWKKDYTNSQTGSGYGKSFFVYTNDYLEDSNNISVVASTIDQKYSSSASIDIGTAQPKILFYKNDSKLGTIWERSLPGTHKIQESEIVEAVPYFISPKEIQNPTLVWEWFINDRLINLNSFKKNLMPLQVSEGTHGTSKLRLDIKNRDKIVQTASKEINIEF